MIKWLKREIAYELKQIRNPDAPYAYIVIGFTVAFVIGCSLAMRASDTMVTP